MRNFDYAGEIGSDYKIPCFTNLRKSISKTLTSKNKNLLSNFAKIHHLKYLSMLNCCKVNEDDGIENVDKGKGNTEVTNYSIIFPLLPL